MATPYSLFFTQDARGDINEIYDYIAHSLSAEKAAHRLMSKIESEIRSLADFPYSGPLVSDVRLAALGYRKLLVERYILVYTVDESKCSVIILRVFYGAMDYLKYL